jgi:ABC-type polysaccharide/polyol phosphate export permease
MYQLIRRDVSVRYKQAVMGIGWAILIKDCEVR